MNPGALADGAAWRPVVARDLLDALPVGILYLQADGTIGFLNAHGAELMGVVLPEVIGQSLAATAVTRVFEDGSVCPPEAYPGLSCLRTGRAHGPQTMGIRREGAAPLWATFQAIPLDGGALVTFMDISERIESERRLRETESRIRALVDGAFEGICISVDGTIVEVNGALADMLGYTRDELIGTSAFDLMTPESAVDARLHIDSGDTAAYQVEGLRKDGSRFPAELLGRNAVYQGRRARITGVRDVTEREQTADALRRWEHIFHHAPWGMATTRPQGDVVTMANPALAAKLGLQPERLKGRSLTDLFAPYERARVRGQLQRLGEEKRLQFEADMMHVGGAAFPASIDAAVVTDRQGARLYHSFHVVDVSARRAEEHERRLLEEQVRHAQKLESLGVLTGGIAHDFNNLLTSVIGHAELALSQVADVSPAAESVRLVKRSAERSAELVRQMLAYAGRSTVATARVDLNDAITSMANLLSVPLSRNVKLQLALDRTIPGIQADPSQLQQMVMTLVTNASEAIGDQDGEITIATSFRRVPPDGVVSFRGSSRLGPSPEDDRWVCLEVSDTGVGMDAETRRKIFEPFFSTKFAGRGLGLAALFGIVRGHRGAISVSSEPGRGSRFAVFLPPDAPPVPSQAPAAPRQPSQQWAHGVVVLADDEDMVRELTARLLSDLGFEVVAVEDGRQALQEVAARAESLRLVVLDGTMPLLGGREVHAQLRREGNAVPVLLMSGYDLGTVDETDDGEGLLLLQKPFSRRTLYAAVEALLTRGAPKAG